MIENCILWLDGCEGVRHVQQPDQKQPAASVCSHKHKPLVIPIPPPPPPVIPTLYLRSPPPCCLCEPRSASIVKSMDSCDMDYWGKLQVAPSLPPPQSGALVDGPAFPACPTTTSPWAPLGASEGNNTWTPLSGVVKPFLEVAGSNAPTTLRVATGESAPSKSHSWPAGATRTPPTFVQPPAHTSSVALPPAAHVAPTVGIEVKPTTQPQQQPQHQAKGNKLIVNYLGEMTSSQLEVRVGCFILLRGWLWCDGIWFADVVLPVRVGAELPGCGGPPHRPDERVWVCAC